MANARPRTQTGAGTRQPTGTQARGQARRLGGGRLAALAGLAVLGIAAFLFLLDVIYRQDDPVAPFFTGNLNPTVAASILVGTLAVALVVAVALLLPRQQPAGAGSWTPGVTCRNCGGWIEGLEGPCPACGSPVP